VFDSARKEVFAKFFPKEPLPEFGVVSAEAVHLLRNQVLENADKSPMEYSKALTQIISNLKECPVSEDFHKEFSLKNFFEEYQPECPPANLWVSWDLLDSAFVFSFADVVKYFDVFFSPWSGRFDSL
jgi:hypothetical protein